jgi:hypothetical protein
MRDDCTVVAKREHGERATPISLLELELVGDLDSFAEHLLTIAVSALAHLVLDDPQHLLPAWRLRAEPRRDRVEAEIAIDQEAIRAGAVGASAVLSSFGKACCAWGIARVSNGGPM